jgi:hypothetical protein
MNIQQTTTESLFNHTGILTHAGDYAGKFMNEAEDILIAADEENNIVGDSQAWADIMVNEITGKIYAVWAAGELTSRAKCFYAEIEKSDCPKAFSESKDKLSFN